MGKKIWTGRSGTQHLFKISSLSGQNVNTKNALLGLPWFFRTPVGLQQPRDGPVLPVWRLLEPDKE
jgi:hypothetical protein